MTVCGSLLHAGRAPTLIRKGIILLVEFEPLLRFGHELCREWHGDLVDDFLLDHTGGQGQHFRGQEPGECADSIEVCEMRVAPPDYPEVPIHPHIMLRRLLGRLMEFEKGFEKVVNPCHLVLRLGIPGIGRAPRGGIRVVILCFHWCGGTCVSQCGSRMGAFIHGRR